MSPGGEHNCAGEEWSGFIYLSKLSFCLVVVDWLIYLPFSTCNWDARLDTVSNQITDMQAAQWLCNICTV